MEQLKRLVPNFLTSMNLFCGCISIVFATRNNFEFAAYMILVAAFFDFIDGMSARLLNVKSDIGKELDSLSDVVSFGVAPSFIIFHFMQINNFGYDKLIFNLLPYLAFIIAIFSSLRLAKFNIDTRQTDSFIGLPTPANGLFFSFIPFLCIDNSFIFNLSHYFSPVLTNNYVLLALVLLFSYLLVSELKLFSLKFKNLRWAENKVRYIFAGLSLLMFIFFSFQSFPLIILFYLGLSVVSNQLSVVSFQ